MADDVLRHVKDGHSLAHAIVDTVREALIVLDRDSRVVAASRSYYRHIGGGDLGKHIFFQSGLQRRLRADDFDTKGTAGHAL